MIQNNIAFILMKNKSNSLKKDTEIFSSLGQYHQWECFTNISAWIGGTFSRSSVLVSIMCLLKPIKKSLIAFATSLFGPLTFSYIAGTIVSLHAGSVTSIRRWHQAWLLYHGLVLISCLIFLFQTLDLSHYQNLSFVIFYNCLVFPKFSMMWFVERKA